MRRVMMTPSSLRTVLMVALALLLLAGCASRAPEPASEAPAVATETPEEPATVEAAPVVTTEVTASETPPPPIQSTGTPAAPAPGEIAPSAGDLPEGVSYTLIRPDEAPEAVPPGIEWTVDRTETLYPGNRWLLVYEHSSFLEGGASGWIGNVQRIRIQENGSSAPIAVLDLMVGDGLPSLMLAHSGTKLTQPGLEGGEGEIERLYFGVAATGGGCAIYGSQMGLWEVALPSGELTERLPVTWPADVIGPSPDGEKVAFLLHAGTPILVIRTMASGEEQRIPLMEAQETQGDGSLGDYTWSPEGDAIAFATVRGVCYGEAPSTTLSVARLADGTVTELATEEGRFLSIEAWWPMGRIEMRDRATYWLNTETGEIRYDPN